MQTLDKILCFSLILLIISAKPRYAFGALGLVAAIGGYLFYRFYTTKDEEQVKLTQAVDTDSCAPLSEELESSKDACLTSLSDEDQLHIEARLDTGNSTIQLSPPCQTRFISNDYSKADSSQAATDSDGTSQVKVPGYGKRKRSAKLAAGAQCFDANLIPDDYPLAKKLLLEHQAIGKNMVDSGYVHSDLSSVCGTQECGTWDDSIIFSHESDDGIVKDEVVAESSLIQLGEEAAGISHSECGTPPKLAGHDSDKFLKSRSCNCSPQHSLNAIDFSRAELCNSMLKLRGDQLEGIGADLDDILKQLTSLQGDVKCPTSPDQKLSNSENSLHLLSLPTEIDTMQDVFHSSVLTTSGYMPGWTPMGKFVIAKEFSIKYLYCLPECPDEKTSMMTAFIASVLVACPERLVDSQITLERILAEVEDASTFQNSEDCSHQRSFVESFYSRLNDMQLLPLLDQLSSLGTDPVLINLAIQLARLATLSFDLDYNHDRTTPSFYMAGQIGGESVREQMLVHTLAHILEIELIFIRPTFVHASDITLSFEHQGSDGKQAILIQQHDDSYHIPIKS